MSGIVDTLINAPEPWVRLRALTDLLGEATDAPSVKEARGAVASDTRILALVDDLKQWPQGPLSRAYDAKDALWRLAMLADFGLDRREPAIEALAANVLAAEAPDGGFLHGGFDHTRSWDSRPYICIAHVMTYALASFGYLGEPAVIRAYEQLTRWQREDGGWHPNARNLPGESGAGESSCPFGTINILRAVGVHPELRDSPMAARGVEWIFTCWERRHEPFRPVGFGIGTTWAKVQYPFVQYQLLKVVDTLSMLPAALPDPRFGEMLELLESRRDEAGWWRAESVNKPYAAFDFGARAASSAWITLVATRALKRSGRLGDG